MVAFPRTNTSTKIEFAPTIAPLSIPTLGEEMEVIHGKLHYHGIDLMSLLEDGVFVRETLEQPTTPLYVRRLESLRENFHALHHWFNVAKAELGYPGELLVAYASKANPSEPVVRTLLNEGAAYECSSSFDVDIVRHAHRQGWIDHTRPILSNGFKIPAYAENLVKLRREGFTRLMPIIDDLDEITPFANSGLSFEVGVRALTDMHEVNRFGLSPEQLEVAVERIQAAGNLTLTMFHAMQTVKASYGLKYQIAMMHSLRTYARLKRIAPTLHRFNLGGGLPARNDDMDFQDWMFQTLRTIMDVCEEEGIPAPDLLIESGRYMVQNHAVKLFRVMKSKMAEDGVPFYVIDGSIMSNFPDAWALGDEFTVLPINNWDSEFIPARLSGLTCDQDDIYPTRKMGDTPILLPADSDGLVVAFFYCGAYQETLGGRRGSKHCLLPEGSEVVLETNPLTGDHYADDYDGPQTAQGVLANMGYTLPAAAMPHG
jgi:arginine decarboxylase